MTLAVCSDHDRVGRHKYRPHRHSQRPNQLPQNSTRWCLLTLCAKVTHRMISLRTKRRSGQPREVGPTYDATCKAVRLLVPGPNQSSNFSPSSTLRLKHGAIKVVVQLTFHVDAMMVREAVCKLLSKLAPAAPMASTWGCRPLALRLHAHVYLEFFEE